MLVGPSADKTQRTPVLCRATTHEPRYLHFVQRGRYARDLFVQQYFGNFIEEFVDAACADRGQHFPNVVLGMRNEWHIFACLDGNYLFVQFVE